MAKREEEVKSLLMQVKEECERVKNSAFKTTTTTTNKQKNVAFSPITSQQIDGETMKTVTDYFLGSKIIVDGDCS